MILPIAVIETNFVNNIYIYIYIYKILKEGKAFFLFNIKCEEYNEK